MPFERLLLKPEAFYAQNRIEPLTATRVADVDRFAGSVVLATGERLPYDHLVLATGARNRVLPLAGADLDGTLMLRSAAEAATLRAALAGADRLVIVGGGFIGLEVAASARARGTEVTVLEAAPRLMGRAVSPAISAFFLEAHRAMGTTVVLDAPAVGIAGAGGRAVAVETAGGRGYPADLVLIAAGVVPNVELAAAAGLATADGILVDRLLTTADPRIFAIGDCARFAFRHHEGPVRLESVQNAIDQGKSVAARILGGEEPYDAVPWFWSDQGSLKLQIAGITTGADHVHLAGSLEEGRAVAYCFRGERLIGIETVNRPAEHMLGRRLLAGTVRLSPADVGHTDFNLKAHMASPAP
jgi:3-phenylpropionate/trans-cinnamate dioxygenase ferredoxin reductase subunit